jgi:ABC-type branched-subunit amino acid transport system ATPase component
LEDFIKDPNIHGILFPSILGITYDKKRRDELIDLALANNTDLLFVDERILLNNDKERKYLDKIFEYINDEEDPDLLLGHTR